MGIVELFIYIIIVVALGIGANWLVDYLGPHPAIINKLIWLVVIIVIAVVLIQAFGLMAYDPKVPRLR